MTDGTRQRMIDAAIPLLERKGLAAMSFTDVLAASGAARGGIYHHFPGGKLQLAEEAARWNGEQIAGYMRALTGSNPLEVLDSFLEGIRPAVEQSTRGAGCAVAAITVNGATDQQGQVALGRVANAAFASWQQVLAEKFEGAGMEPERSAEFAALLVVTLEGSHTLSRAAGSLEPFESAAAALRRMLH
ncbi:TetR/AcrR family transcriptional regulator [Herbiconiux ginsengi]|uniref:Transcriptional regulator, TetR family n=1 Tax=Herbiconiux ginsengi TaxID=381665 RepID=A0A1H3L6P0_9MICO|nr:TetR/AcrR family transcriptional regulator [Herbiconiux ginsengi]SDY60000.1 transcriptional regulator, TetR family [Herbiconiux ginsengi]